MPDSKKTPASNAKIGGYTALVGAGAAALSLPFIMNWEGTRYVTYLDVAGVPTACTGDTNNVGRVGTRYTKEECDERLERQLIAHAAPVLKCTPQLEDHPYQLTAAISLAYNVGSAGYCNSTAARRFNTDDWDGACDALLLWNRAGGRVVPGLTNRRKAERNLCYTMLPEGKVNLP